jgi:hypothetical protein
MCPTVPTISRRQCLLIACLATTQAVLANAKADKRDFFYQDKPKDGKSCANCRMFSLAQGGVGMCAIVDGDVSPNGWCMAYSSRGP